MRSLVDDSMLPMQDDAERSALSLRIAFMFVLGFRLARHTVGNP